MITFYFIDLEIQVLNGKVTFPPPLFDVSHFYFQREEANGQEFEVLAEVTPSVLSFIFLIQYDQDRE